MNVASSRIKEFGVEDRVEIVARDMREIDYREEFDGAYMFFTTFGYFSDRENIDVINRLSRALRAGGRVLIDLWNPARTMHIAYEYGGHVNRWFEAGEYIVLEDSSHDVLNGFVRVKRIYVDKESRRIVAERVFKVRVYMPWEVREIFEGASLKVLRFLGDYSGGEYSPSSVRMIVIGVKT